MRKYELDQSESQGVISEQEARRLVPKVTQLAEDTIMVGLPDGYVIIYPKSKIYFLDVYGGG